MEEDFFLNKMKGVKPIKKDTSILMIEEAIKNKLDVFQCEINDLFISQFSKI